MTHTPEEVAMGDNSTPVSGNLQEVLTGDISSPESDNEFPELNVLIAGLPRSGKSTGLNNIFNLDLTAELSAKPLTDKVVTTRTSKNGVTINVTDTPGLMAANANKDKIVMRDIKNVGVKKTFLFIVTLAVSPSSCITQDYRNILKNLTAIFGKEIWNWSLVLLTYTDEIRNEFQDDQYYQEYLQEHCKELHEVLLSINVKKSVKLFFEYKTFDQFKKETLDGIVCMPVGKPQDFPTQKLFPLQPWTHTYRWPDLALMAIVKIDKDIPDATLLRKALIQMRYGKYTIQSKVETIINTGAGGAARGAVAGSITESTLGGSVNAIVRPLGIAIGLGVGGIAGAITGGATGGVGESTAAAAIASIDTMIEEKSAQKYLESHRAIEN